MKVTFHGHACFEIESSSTRILIDPFLTNNPKAKAKPEDFHELDAILVSHGHDDHIGDTVEIAKKTGAIVVSNFELASYLETFGTTVHKMHIGGKHKFPFGTIKLTPANHGSGIAKGDGTFLYGGLACGFLIEVEGQCVYHAGDTGLFGDMQLIGRQYDLTVAMLPIGDNFVMGPEDAVLAAQWLRSKYVIPMHFNTFPAIQQDEKAFIDLLRRKAPESNGIIMQPGQEKEL